MGTKGFQKGDPNINRKGRPKTEDSVAHILREITAEKDASGKTQMYRICKKAADQAEQGDDPARRFIAERVAGKVADRVITTEVEIDELIIMNDEVKE